MLHSRLHHTDEQHLALPCLDSRIVEFAVCLRGAFAFGLRTCFAH